MKNLFVLLGASALALGILSGGAEAKKRTYEINGQLYSYDSSDPEQVAAARRRIEAANAADAAKAKAEVERARNPLVGVFGSPLQREAAQTQARLQQILSEPVPAAKGTRASKAEMSEAGSEPAGEQFRNETAAADSDEPTTAPAQEQARVEIAPEAGSPSPPMAEPVTAQAAPQQTVRSVTFDIGSGIKTTVMTDGSVQEEPFDSSTLSKLVSAHEGANSLEAFVDRLRRASPDETTGSIPPGGTQTQPSEATAQARPRN